MVYQYYSPTIKVLAVRLALEGISFGVIRDRLGANISRQSFQRWLELHEETQAIIRDPQEYKQCGRPRLFNRDDQSFMEALIYNQPGLFLDEVQDRLRDYTGHVAAFSTIRMELHSRLRLTLKKANTSNIRKSLLDKACWVSRMANVPAEFLVFTGRLSMLCSLVFFH